MGESRGIILILIRTYHYLKLSSELNIPYNPHSFRSQIVKVIPSLEYKKLFKDPFKLYRTFEKNLLDYIEQDIGNERLELYFPLIFLNVLKECNSPSDIFKVALQMRNIKEVRLYREVFYNIETEINK